MQPDQIAVCTVLKNHKHVDLKQFNIINILLTWIPINIWVHDYAISLD